MYGQEWHILWCRDIIKISWGESVKLAAEYIILSARSLPDVGRIFKGFKGKFLSTSNVIEPSDLLSTLHSFWAFTDKRVTPRRSIIEIIRFIIRYILFGLRCKGTICAQKHQENEFTKSSHLLFASKQSSQKVHKRGLIYWFKAVCTKRTFTLNRHDKIVPILCCTFAIKHFLLHTKAALRHRTLARGC